MNSVRSTSAINYHCGICQLGNETVPMPESMHAICMECFKKMAPKDLIAPPATIIPPTIVATTPPPIDEKREFLEFLKPFLQTDESFAFFKREYEQHPEKFFIYKDDKGHYGCVYMRIEYEEKVTNYYIRYLFLDPNLSANDFFKAFLNTTIYRNKFRSSPSPIVFYQDSRNDNRRRLEKFAKSLGYWVMHISKTVWISKGIDRLKVH